MDKTDLVAWINSHVDEWKNYRDSNFQEDWREYYRIWRCIWDSADKTRASERSRLMSPATAQAVESTVSELEEATFGRDQWFDIQDDFADQNPEDMFVLRNQLKEDCEANHWKSSISEIMLNGCIYGTGIGELVTEEKTELIPAQENMENTGIMQLSPEEKNYICVKIRPVLPQNFAIDPAATTIDEALGVAIHDLVPAHLIHQGIADGVYDDVDFGAASVTQDDAYSGEKSQIPSENVVRLLRYYGKVPSHFVNDTESDELVEAIVILINDTEVLKAIPSPYFMKDRPVVAYKHDRVPNRFFGRGVVEKGYMMQKALDAELRARADSLALTTHPMMAVDASRLPRGAKPTIRPGQTVLTNGDPNTILKPFNFGQTNPVTYKESNELERMVSMATGAMDQISGGHNTLGGMSMMLGASIKRQKRTLANFQEEFLVPALTKASYRFMQFDPTRYPVMDYKFRPSSTLGLMAREFETQQLIQLLQVTQPDSPVYLIILSSIYENSSIANRELMLSALEQMLQQSQEPPQPAPNPVGMAQVQVQQEAIDLNRQKAEADLALKQADIQLKAEKLNLAKQELNDKKEDAKEKNDLTELSMYLKGQVESGKLDDKMADRIMGRLQ